MLYPFKFIPIYKKRAWGGEKIGEVYYHGVPKGNIGEAWLLSGLEDDLTEVSNGFLEENTVNELTEVYMGEMVGDKVYDKFGEEFPLLIKLIDTKERLSVQVHPSDELAAKRHNAYGKSELWYVMDAEDGAVLYLGFKKGTTKENYLTALEKGDIESLLNTVKVKNGDIYYIPSGTVHSIGAGITLLEVQQTSDITYRIFDWNRKDEDGEPRELHTELALDAINFEAATPENLRKKGKAGEQLTITTNHYFNIEILDVVDDMSIDYGKRDSFTILMCLEGKGEIEYDIDGIETISKGELVLIPSELEEMNLYGEMKLMSIYL
ncbi:MAG: type I phosphomannose isomerase catalytic subunit [Rikenellaceae bacterium]